MAFHPNTYSLVCGLLFLFSPCSQAVLSSWEQQLSVDQQQYLQQHAQINIGVMADWPPLNFVDEQGRPDGFGADLIGVLNQRLNGRLQLVSGVWADQYAALEQGTIDGLMDLTPRIERLETFSFTKLYLDIPHVIIASDQMATISSESELIGKRVAVEEGFGTVVYLNENFPKIEQLIYKNTREALDAVVRGEAEAYIGNRAVAVWIMQQELMANLKVHSLSKKPGSKLAIGVRKQDEVLSSILDLALNDISREEIQAIQRKWVSADQVINTLSLTQEEKRFLTDHPVIRLASDRAWRPFEYLGSDGGFNGIAADYFALIEQRLGLKFVRSPDVPWYQVIEAFERKELDVLTSVMSTPQRRQFTLFTQPYISHPMVIVTKDDIAFMAGVESLENKKVLVERSGAAEDLLAFGFPRIELIKADTTEDALTALAEGRGDAYVGNIATASHVIRTKGLSNLQISGEMPFNFELSIGIRDDWPQLQGILQKVLDSISEQEHQQILDRWIRVNVAPAVDPWPMIRLFGLLLLVVVAVLYWNYLLKRRVLERTAELEYRAQHDVLTGLANRGAVLEHLQQRIDVAKREGGIVALLFLDLDDFKKVNDTLGHEVGDELLISAANRLRSLTRFSDIVGRLGGDEFVVITSSMQTLDHVSLVARTIREGLQESFSVHGRMMYLSASIGIAMFPDDADTAHELLRKADSSMYHAKQEGGNSFSYYSETLNEYAHLRLQIEEAMYHALERNEISVHFQPLVSVTDQQVLGFEALIRWYSSELGFIPPVQFIAIAEQNGFIVAFGKFVLERAIAECASWNAQFGVEWHVSVNLSPRQFRDPELVPTIMALLQQYQLPPELLILEITEGVFLRDDPEIAQQLLILRESGVGLAMDDFGTGFSSLSYLRRHPFTSLKIDREFIEEIAINESDRRLVQATLAMSEGLGIRVVAEGVETREQLDILVDLACPAAQGYFISKPLSTTELKLWLYENQQKIELKKKTR